MKNNNWTQRREALRKLFAGEGCFTPAAIFDPASALIAQDIGYESAILPGSTVSLTVHAAPDNTLLTISELAEQTRRICRACDIPLIVDGDFGYGNAYNVRRAIEDLEAAGTAGVCLHDTLWPDTFGSPGESRLISIEEGAAKLRAAVDARLDPSLVIVGRTDAAAITDLNDALRRACAYEASGVDALFIYGLGSRDDVDALAACTTVPLILGGFKNAMGDDTAYMRTRRVRMVTQASLPIMAALQAVQATLLAQRAGVKPAAIANLAPPPLMQRVTREPDFASWAAAFLK